MTSDSPKAKKIVCPHCNAPNTWRDDNKYRPFCSYRCKLIDLGDWAAEKHRVPGEPADPNNNRSDETE